MVLSGKYSKFNAERVLHSQRVEVWNHQQWQNGNLVGESGYTTIGLTNWTETGNHHQYDVHIDEVNEIPIHCFQWQYAGLRAPIAHTVSYTLDGQAAYGGITGRPPG